MYHCVSYESWELVTCGRNLLQLPERSSHSVIYALLIFSFHHNSRHEETWLNYSKRAFIQPEGASILVVVIVAYLEDCNYCKICFLVDRSIESFDEPRKI